MQHCVSGLFEQVVNRVVSRCPGTQFGTHVSDHRGTDCVYCAHLTLRPLSTETHMETLSML